MRIGNLILFGGVMALGSLANGEGITWKHPAGMICRETIAEIRAKCERREWARRVVENLKIGVQPWLDVSMERLRELFPKERAGVYWLLTCPKDHGSLRFDPFNDETVTCQRCGKVYDTKEASRAVPPGHIYAGAFYDGWACRFVQSFALRTKQMALLYAISRERKYAERAADMLRLFAVATRALRPTSVGGFSVLWTYHREGDSPTLLNLAVAYELLRGAKLFSEKEQHLIEVDLLKRWCDAALRDEQYTTDWNNVYHWLRCVAMVGVAIEDRDYVDWAFGYGTYSPENMPKHRSLAYVSAHHFKPDGAFWGLACAYHLYAVAPYCEDIVLGRSLARQDPEAFPPKVFDYTSPGHPRGNVARRALRWFISLALPDYTMAPFGDMGGRCSLATYTATAEIGYRFFDIAEAAYYPSMQSGQRGQVGLVYGAEVLEQKPVSFASARLSSGFCALRREHGGNRLYAGINYVQPGSAHSHADKLTLITYMRDRLLAGEKRTYYNDQTQRAYSSASYAHNTVTINETSQRRGHSLKGNEVPQIKRFLSNPVMEFSEVWGDHIYTETEVYRRTIALFDEYLVDIFRVKGGDTHDWFWNGIGDALEVSVPLEAGHDFQPAAYVTRGAPDYRHGRTDETFHATWRIPAEKESPYEGRRVDVFSRVTLLASPATEVYALNTFPEPGGRSLLVRRRESHAPFVALHEAFHTSPTITAARRFETNSDDFVAFEVTSGDGRRIILSGSGRAGADFILDGTLGVMHWTANGEFRAAALVGGRRLEAGGIKITSHTPVNVWLSRTDADHFQIASSRDLGYETVDGSPIYSAGEAVTISVTLQQELFAPAPPPPRRVEVQKAKITSQQWDVKAKRLSFTLVLPGQTEAGPRICTLRIRGQ